MRGPMTRAEIRLKLAKAILTGDSVKGWLADDAERLAKLVVALNEWIQGGGFLPRTWMN